MHLYCDFAQSSLFWSNQIGKISSLVFVIACFALCCSFAAGAAKCVQLTGEVKDICPFYNNTVEGHLPEIDRNAIIHHFKAFMTECSSLSRIFVCYTLFPLCLLTEVVLPCCDVFLFTHPATMFIYCTVKNGPPFLTALICLHVHKYVYFHCQQSHIFQACHRRLGLRLLLYPCLPFHLHCQVTSFKPVTIIFASVCFFTLVCLLISVSIVC